MELLAALLSQPELNALIVGAIASRLYEALRQGNTYLASKLNPWVHRGVLFGLTTAAVLGLRAIGLDLSGGGDVSTWSESMIFSAVAALLGHAVHHLKAKLPQAEPVDPPAPADAA
jgi:hypothetical protein